MFVVRTVVSRLVLLITPKKQARHRLLLLLAGPLQLTMTQKAPLLSARIATNRPPAVPLQSRLWAIRPLLLAKFLLGLMALVGSGLIGLRLLYLLLFLVQVAIVTSFTRMDI